jgi:hypothetical protein
MPGLADRVPRFAIHRTDYGRAVMIPPLDVFSVENNEPLWLASAESLVQALEIVRKRGPGSYCIFSHQTGHKTHYEVDLNGQVKPVQPTRG